MLGVGISFAAAFISLPWVAALLFTFQVERCRVSFPWEIPEAEVVCGKPSRPERAVASRREQRDADANS